MASRMIAVVVTFLLACHVAADITLVKNGYEGIVVSITESLPQSETTINRIKQFFTDASRDLFLATHNRVYFREIAILIPKHWNSKVSYTEATTETFHDANVRIDGLAKGGMATRSYNKCGYGGIFINIPKIYMTGDLQKMIPRYGPPGRTIAHEWGHFRWGLFDEYPVNQPNSARFYRNKHGSVEAVKCGKYLNGVNVGDCHNDRSTGLPTQSCWFKEDKVNPGVTASLMDYHWIPQVTTFCDNDVTNPATLHNNEAPSRQNAVCGHRSCWEVMRQHRDFANGNSRPLPYSHNTTPKFRIMTGKAKRYVLVLDVSGSMGNKTNVGSRIEVLRQSAADFLLRAVPSGYYVGIVTFSSRSSIVAPLTKIASSAVRKSLVSYLPKRANGGTNIKSGLETGIKVLGASDGGTLILVSDGEDNSNYLESMTPVFRQKSITVNTILIGDQADNDMNKLASSTRGKTFFVSGTLDTTDLLSAFRSTLTDNDSGIPGAAPVEIQLESLWIGALKEVIQSVSIDSSVGRDTEFMFSYTGTTFTLDVVVISPSGVNYTVNGPNGQHIVVTKQMIIVIKNETEVGSWTVILRNPGTARSFTQFHVTSKASTDDSHPLRMWTHLSQQEIDFNDPSTLTMIVRVDLRKGYDPVIGANVEVQVGSSPWKSMKDDGLGVDVTRDDGFYSITLLKFSGNGKFPLVVRANSADGDRTKLFVGGNTHSFYRFDEDADDAGPTHEAVGQFQRINTAGFIKVVNLTPDTDLFALYPFPPAEVRDLRVSAMSYERKTVTVQWTAVGDYVEDETASSYDIRFSGDIKQLLHSFENASQIDNSDVIEGNLSSPSASLETETFVIRFLPEYMDRTLFFGLKVNHSRGRISGVSNIISTAIVSLPPEEPPTVEQSAFFTTAILVGIVSGVIVLLLLVVALLLACKRYKSSRVADERDNAA